MTRPYGPPQRSRTAEKGERSGMEKFTIATVAEKSPDFRRVLWTGKNTQLVIMTIPPGGEIGEEVHEDIDQILTFVSGVGRADVGGESEDVAQGDLVVVPAGTRHNFRNTGGNPLVLYTVYGPPEHADGVVHHTKEEADAAEEAGEDEPPSS
jgi:mannose-6-phosphate isomerase-like protein (cupin superfamily)